MTTLFVIIGIGIVLIEALSGAFVWYCDRNSSQTVAGEYSQLDDLGGVAHRQT